MLQERLNLLNEPRKKLPAAIRRLRELQKKGPSPELAKDLRSFNTAKPHNQDAFTKGVLEFTRIANLSSEKRKTYYGSEFCGLHYQNDLAKRWNGSSPESIKAHQLIHICPEGWDYILKDGYSSLIYKGDDPSGALDKLLQGPTVIDCGMFCQLSIWFGIKHMLGKESFNQVFGRTPFYLTQLVYSPISPNKPYMGNPLLPFFNKDPLKNTMSSDTVSIEHVFNHFLYQIKHPGGAYGGDNCVVVRGKYSIFDPTLEVTADLKRTDVEQLLLKEFNSEQDSNDRARLAIYKKEDPNSNNSSLSMTYGELIKSYGTFSNVTIAKIGPATTAKPLHIQFNFKLFRTWVSEVLSSSMPTSQYTPLKDDQLTVSKELKGKIPHENRGGMSFSNFKVENPLQEKMHSIALKFCQDVMMGRSPCVILTGQAGVGKTASAVSCAKELASRGKRVLWISEVMVRGWTDQAKSMAELEACYDEIRALFKSKPDVIILDDDNLVGSSGKVILEEALRYQTETPGVGLFITSNEPVTLEKLYGHDHIRKTYHFPPFPGYNSDQFKNTTRHENLKGKCMRPRIDPTIMQLSGPERIEALRNRQSTASAGIVVNNEFSKCIMHAFPDAEFVPAFLQGTLPPIRQSLEHNRTVGPTYESLTATQKKWLYRFERGGMYTSRGFKSSHAGIAVKKFEISTSKVIIIELVGYTGCKILGSKKTIADDCLRQLIRVLNYAHDCGGKKVVLLNNTSFSDSDMLRKIKEGIPEREKERTVARLNTLLFSPDIPEDHTVNMDKHLSSPAQSLAKANPTKRQKVEANAFACKGLTSITLPEGSITGVLAGLLELLESARSPSYAKNRRAPRQKRDISTECQMAYDRRFALTRILPPPRPPTYSGVDTGEEIQDSLNQTDHTLYDSPAEASSGLADTDSSPDLPPPTL